MYSLLENWSYQNKLGRGLGLSLLLYVLLLCPTGNSAQIGNYVSNGSFETVITCSANIKYAKYWNMLDSVNGLASFLASKCLGAVPFYGTGYQFPKHGDNFIATSTFFCPLPSCAALYNRCYLRNRLKQTLSAGQTYCVKFYVNIANVSTYGIDGFSAYFGDALSLDTIKKFGMPLSYLTPQIQNPTNNIITDTLNWTLVTGTFVATGSEKFMVIGNFKSDASTSSMQINPTYSPAVFADICTDAVSCIELNLPAYAGPDQAMVMGDSVFIGREPDFAIDPGCIWFQLPGMIPLDTISGLWVKPTITTTYVVRQILDCSSEKWDTVVVHMNITGLYPSTSSGYGPDIKIYPVPANDFLDLKILNTNLLQGFTKSFIYNNVGELIREEVLRQHFDKLNISSQHPDGTFKIKTNDLSPGVYFLKISGKEGTVSKRFVISR